MNGKIYVGITSQKIEKRWGKNGNNYIRQPKFYNAIKKYGWNEGFYHEIFASGLTKEEAEKMEIKLIKELGTREKNKGYNVAKGGKISSGCIIPVYQYDTDGKFIKYWNDIDDAQNALGIHRTEILRVCRKERNYVYGFVFRFEPDNNISCKVDETKTKPVLQYDMLGNFIAEFDCAFTAAKQLNEKSYLIVRCCKRKDRLTFHGSRWFFKNEFDEEVLRQDVENYKKTSTYKLSEFCVEQYDLSDNFIMKFDNFYELQNAYGWNYDHLWNCLKCSEGKHKSVYGYKWKAYPKLKQA